MARRIMPVTADCCSSLAPDRTPDSVDGQTDNRSGHGPDRACDRSNSAAPSDHSGSRKACGGNGSVAGGPAPAAAPAAAFAPSGTSSSRNVVSLSSPILPIAIPFVLNCATRLRHAVYAAGQVSATETLLLEGLGLWRGSPAFIACVTDIHFRSALTFGYRFPVLSQTFEFLCHLHFRTPRSEDGNLLRKAMTIGD